MRHWGDSSRRHWCDIVWNFINNLRNRLFLLHSFLWWRIVNFLLLLGLQWSRLCSVLLLLRSIYK